MLTCSKQSPAFTQSFEEYRLKDNIITSMQTVSESASDLAQEIEAAGEKIRKVRAAIGNVIFGQQHVIDETLITIMSGGHLLLIGVPGLAKTKLVEVLGVVLSLEDKRIQFTPDLMPADIIGSEVLEESETGRRSFRFIKGPVFCQVLMADEINRASPRTQSALLQAMQEHHVSVAGQRYSLPNPFHVLATQNPLEQEGTYPLPEAQLDRFLMQVNVSYPDLEAERRMLLATTGTEEAPAQSVMTADELQHMQRLVRRVPVGESVVDAILTLVRRGRPEESDHDGVRKHVAWGPGPRASQALMLAVRAPGAVGRPPVAVDRRRDRPRRAGAAPPHGAQLRSPRRRHHDRRSDRSIGGAVEVAMAEVGGPISSSTAPRELRARSEGLASTLPPLLVEAQRIATSISQGVHGRRRVGPGETFWQFRRYQPGDPSTAIDWRQSAKRLPVYVRQNEWESAQSVWLWRDSSSSMAYKSNWAEEEKAYRADLLLMALACLLSRAGEHIGLLGHDRIARTGRVALDRMALSLTSGLLNQAEERPPVAELPRFSMAVCFGDFLGPLDALDERLRTIATGGVSGILVHIVDPAEEDLPFVGRTRFEGPEQEGAFLIGRVEQVQEAYHEHWARRQEALIAMARSIGWRYIRHRTDRPPQTALLALFEAISEGVG